MFSKQPPNQSFLQQKEELALLGEEETPWVGGKGKGKCTNSSGNQLREVRLFRESRASESYEPQFTHT